MCHAPKCAFLSWWLGCHPMVFVSWGSCRIMSYHSKVLLHVKRNCDVVHSYEETWMRFAISSCEWYSVCEGSMWMLHHSLRKTRQCSSCVLYLDLNSLKLECCCNTSTFISPDLSLSCHLVEVSFDALHFHQRQHHIQATCYKVYILNLKQKSRIAKVFGVGFCRSCMPKVL